MSQDLAAVVASAQRVAGIVAARGRGDVEGARELMSTFEDHAELAAGALLVAELSLGMLHRQSEESLDGCVRELCIHLENAVR